MKIIVFLTALLFFSISTYGQPKSIESSEFGKIGGIEQWITIKGADASKPVILFLHGGPGSPLSPYADAIFKGWEKDFVLVQWDQRGAGKTYGKYAPEELDPEFLAEHPLTVERMVKDGIEVSGYISTLLGEKKIILFGTSWGSVIGAKMASERPDLFHAYIGHSQLVNPSENNKAIYTQLLQIVKEQNDEKSLEILQTIGSPPYDLARNTGQFIRVIKNYERKNSKRPLPEWEIISSEYNSPVDVQHREDGDDYSFLNYAGDKPLGIEPMATSINLLEDNYKFQIPVYIIQGEEDILTPKEITSTYFEKIEAPEKELIFVPEAAHGFNTEVVATLYRILLENIVPHVKN